jgi:hypothetical protein
MTQQLIVTIPVNSGEGTPLANAFNICNDNFTELYNDVANIGVNYGNANVAAYLPTNTSNVQANYFIGDGSYLTGIVSSYGNANVADYMPTFLSLYNGDITAATVSTTGNITAGTNIVANGNITVVNGVFSGNGSGLTGVIATGNVGAASQLSNGSTVLNIPVSSGNIIGNVSGVTGVFLLSSSELSLAGNILASGTISGAGEVIGGNILTAGVVSSASNVTGGNILTAGVISAVGNIRGNNLNTAGIVTATGNVIGGNLLSSGLISAIGTITGANITGGNILTAGQVSATGNIYGSYLNGNGAFISGLPAGYSNANTASFLAAFGSNTISTTGTITAGNITGGNLSVGTGTVTVNNIVNSGANGTGNIGNSSTYFNTVFATATTALYADLAECYSTDAEYAPGTVVSFGGEHEVTITDIDSDPLVAGVISTKPAYLMNSGLDSEHVAKIALTGRVPCKVKGPVTRGAMMVSAGLGLARAESRPAIGTVIGKAVESFDGDVGIIEIVVGRL